MKYIGNAKKNEYKKENKMKHAVIFTGGRAPLPEETGYYFSRVSTADYIVCADSGLETYHRYKKYFRKGLRYPDYILGDMDSLKNRRLLRLYGMDNTRIYPCDKDFTDTELALQAVYSQGETFVTLVGGSGGSLDHFMGIYNTFNRKEHAHVWLTEEQCIYYLQDGDHLVLRNLDYSGRIAATVPLGKAPEGRLNAEGLEWGSDIFFKDGLPTLSNRISREFYEGGRDVTFTAEGGSYFVYAPLDSYGSLTQSKGNQ